MAALNGEPTVPFASSQGGEEGVNVLRSVDRVVMVLNAVMHGTGPLTVVELSRITGLNRGVVHRLVQALTHCGLLSRTQRTKYELGPLSLLYANAFLDRLAIRRVALPYTIDLRNRLAANASVVFTLNMRIGSEMTVIDTLWDSKTALDSIWQVGMRFPLTESATGRVVAAYMDPGELASMIGSESFDRLEQRLADVRSAGGVDVTVGEYRPGVMGVAAAVFTRTGVDTAIGIYGPEMKPEDVSPESALAGQMRRTAAAIGAAVDDVSV